LVGDAADAVVNEAPHKEGEAGEKGAEEEVLSWVVG